jgi:hypothetical protein
MSDIEFANFLKSNNFVPCPEHSIDVGFMGSKVDAFRSEKGLIRVVVDRGQRFIDVFRTETDSWIPVFDFALLFDPTFVVKTGSFSEGVKTLIKYWPNVKSHL